MLNFMDSKIHNWGKTSTSNILFICTCRIAMTIVEKEGLILPPTDNIKIT